MKHPRASSRARLGLLLLLACVSPPASGASGAPASNPAPAAGAGAVEQTVLTLDASAQESCEQYRALLRESSIPADARLEAVEKRLCSDRPLQPGSWVTVVVFRQKEAPAATDDGAYYSPKFSASFGADLSEGTEHYVHLKGKLDFSKLWRNLNLLHVGVEGAKETETTVERGKLGVDFVYALDPTWALFSFGAVSRDTARSLELNAQEYLGAIYHFLPYRPEAEIFAALSVGLGYRHDLVMDGTSRSAPEASVYGKYSQKLNDALSFVLALWFQESLLDASDFRMIADGKLVVGKDGSGLFVSIGVQDAFWNRPFLQTKKNSFMTQLQLGYAL